MACECSPEELENIAVWTNSPYCPICGEKLDETSEKMTISKTLTITGEKKYLDDLIQDLRDNSEIEVFVVDKNVSQGDE